MTHSRKQWILWAITFTISLELLTVVCRLIYGGTGAEFAEAHGVPAWLRIHHFWWGLVLFLAVFRMQRYPRIRFWGMTFALGVFFSDWLHHLVVAPLLHGNMAWHWP